MTPQEILKHYGSEASLGPVPAALVQAVKGRRKERPFTEGNALLALLPTDVQVSMPEPCKCILPLSTLQEVVAGTPDFPHTTSVRGLHVLCLHP